ncbi:hypothetical protein CLAIMM_10041 [Cladophialophora immunda]|nr:hypothetical protein CLAIMM_10041 [Cladophialophora immunda]
MQLFAIRSIFGSALGDSTRHHLFDAPASYPHIPTYLDHVAINSSLPPFLRRKRTERHKVNDIGLNTPYKEPLSWIEHLTPKAMYVFFSLNPPKVETTNHPDSFPSFPIYSLSLSLYPKEPPVNHPGDAQPPRAFLSCFTMRNVPSPDPEG